MNLDSLLLAKCHKPNPYLPMEYLKPNKIFNFQWKFYQQKILNRNLCVGLPHYPDHRASAHSSQSNPATAASQGQGGSTQTFFLSLERKKLSFSGCKLGWLHFYNRKLESKPEEIQRRSQAAISLLPAVFPWGISHFKTWCLVPRNPWDLSPSIPTDTGAVTSLPFPSCTPISWSPPSSPAPDYLLLPKCPPWSRPSFPKGG